MKGFGFNREKQMLVKALSTKSMEKLKKVVAKLEGKMSAEQIATLVMEAIEDLPSEEKKWAYMNFMPEEATELIHQEFMSLCYRVLSEKGFEPGRDFWEEGIALVLKPATFEALCEEMPNWESEWNQLKEEGMVMLSETSPLETLEADLGVPFGENIVKLIEERLSQLSDNRALFYVHTICRGVENRTGFPLFDRLIARPTENSEFVMRIFQLIENRDKIEPTNEWAVDLICAAGGEAYILPDPEHPGEYQFTEEAWELLDRLYASADGISIREEYQRLHVGKAIGSQE